MTSEPVTAVIVIERTSGLSISQSEMCVVSQAIQYKQACKSDAKLHMKYWSNNANTESYVMSWQAYNIMHTSANNTHMQPSIMIELSCTKCALLFLIAQ